MNRVGLFTVLGLGFLTVAPAHSSPPVPSISISASGSGSGNDSGTASVSGTIHVPAGWELSIHVVTIRFQKNGGTRTLNALLPVKGAKFGASTGVKKGSYTVWAVIDVKDAAGRERQISSEPTNFQVP